MEILAISLKKSEAIFRLKSPAKFPQETEGRKLQCIGLTVQ